MRASGAGAREALHPAAPVERSQDVATAFVNLLQCEASSGPEAAEEEETENRSKHRKSSLFVGCAGRTAALLGRTNVLSLFSLVKRLSVTISKWLNKRRCSARARRIPQVERTYRCRPQGW